MMDCNVERIINKIGSASEVDLMEFNFSDCFKSLREMKVEIERQRGVISTLYPEIENLNSKCNAYNSQIEQLSIELKIAQAGWRSGTADEWLKTHNTKLEDLLGDFEQLSQRATNLLDDAQDAQDALHESDPQ